MKAYILTSIAAPTAAVETLAEWCATDGDLFVYVGDEQSPDITLDGCGFLSLTEQHDRWPELAAMVPVRHYSRKVFGYLEAIHQGARAIIDLDDDNEPAPALRLDPDPMLSGRWVPAVGDAPRWVNSYGLFSEEERLWPRGLPLDRLADPSPFTTSGPSASVPVRQHLVNGDPDVDAIGRLTMPGRSVVFRDDAPALLAAGSWTPINSQCTTWLPEAYALLYLPSRCSFRATDIWRGLVAQRLLWTCGWVAGVTGPRAEQVRNPHDLMRDFEEEVPVYLATAAMADSLWVLGLPVGREHLSANLLRCYALLVERGWVSPAEPSIVERWLAAVDASLR